MIGRVAHNQNKIAFTYAGKIWLVDKNGGAATRLTDTPNEETNPVFSPDGRQIAYSRMNGGDWDIYVTSAENKTEARRVTMMPEADFMVAWTPDGKGIFYTRYPHAGERPDADLNFYQQIYFHRLGSPENTDVYSAGKDFPRIAEIDLHTSRDGRWLLASVANGDGGEYAHYVRDLRAAEGAVWRQVARFEDGVKSAEFSADGAALYLRSVKDAPRGKILRLPLDGTELKDASLVIPESDAVIQSFAATASFLFTAELIGGPSRVRRFDLTGKDAREIPLPANSGAGALVALEGNATDDRILFLRASWTEPSAWYLHDPAENAGAGSTTKTALAHTSPVDFSDIETVREFATAKDGAKIPVNILRRKGTKLDGSNPTLLTGYGGYSISLTPGFDFTRRVWFDRGGIFVVANLRGGGEYGEAWHLAGNLTRKQTVFDDFAACARHLIDRGYTRHEKLAIRGGSNGGLLMGALLTQHPGLARAVISHVGLYDMLRVELDPNGAFNVTEFGTVKDRAQFAALHAYSPYHRVVDGEKYPAVLLLAGEHDGRVNPAHSRKMAARLQAATGSDRPVLLRLSSDSGHGMGTALSEQIEQHADVFAFLFQQLAMNAGR